MKNSKIAAQTKQKSAKDNIVLPEPAWPSLVEILPGDSYIPVVGVHTTLLLFSGLFLPRTTFLQDITYVQADLEQISSTDHPQHPFLEALTLNPLATLVYICLGAAVLQSWWAGYVRDWWSLSIVEGSENEKRLQKAIIDRQKLRVRLRGNHRSPLTSNPVIPGIYDCMACHNRHFYIFTWFIDFIRRTLHLVRLPKSNNEVAV